MQFLQCLGCRSRRGTAQYSSSTSSIRKLKKLKLFNNEKANVLDNVLNSSIDQTPIRWTYTRTALTIRSKEQSGNSTVGSQSPRKHDVYKRIQSILSKTPDIDQADFDSGELARRLTRLQNRSVRYDQYIRDTPVNSRQYNRYRAHHVFVRRQILEAKIKIAVYTSTKKHFIWMRWKCQSPQSILHAISSLSTSHSSLYYIKKSKRIYSGAYSAVLFLPDLFTI